MTARTLAVCGAAALFACGAAHAQDDGAAPTGLEAGARPNILLIVGDDLGYLDLGLYGSEIRTPNIDALGRSGVILTDFYTSVACQPTRAMLMSGTDNHLAGVGTQGRTVPDNPHYRNYLNDRVVTIADRMQEAGYHTYMSGKWHLGSQIGQTPADRGFERSFVLIDPGAGHFDDMMHFGSATAKANYQMDGRPLERLPTGFYSTIGYTDHMIDFIDEAAQDDAPFFGYLAYTAPHWPIHALDEDMEKTRGMYDEGWDVIRERRMERWAELGFGPAGAEEPGFVPSYVPWDTLSDEDKARKARVMEAFAAMVERLDAEIGRLVAHLEEIGELDNTLIMFMSDNGAEINDERFLAAYVDTFDNSLDNIGRPNSYQFIGPGWGEAGSAPYYLSKTSIADGGVHVPAFIHAPGLGLEPGRSDKLVAVFDLAPTFLELAGASPDDISGPDISPITGRSFADILRSEDGAGRSDEEIVSFEHGGQRAIRRGDWKALWINPPSGTGDWQLFNLAEDPGEIHDVAAENAELLAEMTAAWDRYAEASGVMLQAPPLATRGNANLDAAAEEDAEDE